MSSKEVGGIMGEMKLHVDGARLTAAQGSCWLVMEGKLKIFCLCTDLVCRIAACGSITLQYHNEASKESHYDSSCHKSITEGRAM